jgi:uncharacterized protein YecE (DUF72 family)
MAPLLKNDKMGIFVGTSGWTYDDWNQHFYPNEVKGAERLSFYAAHFDTLEVNATFYHQPTPTMIASWNRRLGDKFHLVVKGSRVITHLKKLHDCLDPLRAYLTHTLQINRLKAILWQLPPALYKDIESLERFLSLLPQNVRHAIEFCHKSWWDEETAKTLARHGVAFVTISHPTLPATVFPTADFLYARFHGQGQALYRYDYSDEELCQWAELLRPHLVGRTLYAFFNNDFDANAVRNAISFREIILTTQYCSHGSLISKQGCKGFCRRE